MRLERLVLLLTITTQCACASVQLPSFALPSPNVRYRPYTVRTTLDADELFDAAQRVASIDGERADVDASRRRVVWYRRITADTRERRDVRITVTGQVRIRIETELLDESGGWIRNGQMCRTYAHARERDLAIVMLRAMGLPDRAQRLLAMRVSGRRHRRVMP